MMIPISQSEITAFIEEHIGLFHDKQLEELRKLPLLKVLKRKNPYLFRVKNLVVASDLVKYITDAFLISREETNFGVFLEEIALFVCGQVYGGKRSSLVGIDLEFERDGKYHIVSIKSGPSWGNSDQVNKMAINFHHAMDTLHTSMSAVEIQAINGCCYGRDVQPAKQGKIRDGRGQILTTVPYLKLCGKQFWSYISGVEHFYIDIIEPLGYRAKQKNDIFYQEYASIINRFTQEFISEFCSPSGAIRWDLLVAYSSGNTNAKRKKRRDT